MKTTLFVFAANGLLAIWNVYDGEAFWAAMNAFFAGAMALMLVMELQERRS